MKAVVVGFGVIGQDVVKSLEKMGCKPLIIDNNVDHVASLIAQDREAVYGEASFPNMLEMAKIESASLLIITIPDSEATLNIIQQAREIQPDILIVARALHLEDQTKLIEAGVKFICCDDEEIRHAFNRILAQVEPCLKPIQPILG